MAAWGDATWLITGASTGFGREMARLVLARGGRVVATARDPASLDELVGASDGRVLALALDVTDADAIGETMRAVAAFGGADVLFNNAGYGFLGGVEESSPDEIMTQFETNLFGAIRLARAVLPTMRERGRGFIVNMSSIAGVRSFAGSGFYAGSKFALEGVSEALSAEVAPFGIGVMIVEPGFFRTDFAGRSIRKTGTPHPAYDGLARARDEVRSVDGAQPGDPVRGVAAILAAMEADEPPLRLALGSDAYRLVAAALDARRAELERWVGTARGTDLAER